MTVLERIGKVLSRTENSGVAAIEFAICATLFLTILAGVVDIGRLLWTTAQLDTAVSAGAQYAANNAARVASDPSALATDIGNVVANLNGSGWATATVAVNNNNDKTGCYCPSGSPGNWSWGGAKTCASACSAGGGVAGQFVTISASRAISPIFSSFGFVRNGSLNRSALVQTQ
jgi:Flp pilus assembly protein TadG